MTPAKVSAVKRAGILMSAATIAAVGIHSLSASPAFAVGSSDFGVSSIFGQPITSGTSSVVEAAVLGQINVYRAQHGLGALSEDAGLASGAKSWAQHLTSTGVPPGHPVDGNFYENVAYCGSPDRAVVLWDASPPHKSNMLERGITRGGVGVVTRPDGSYTVVFRAL